ncbi:MAG: hypothetical protein ABSG94_09035 [Brevinematales bacterium]
MKFPGSQIKASALMLIFSFSMSFSVMQSIQGKLLSFYLDEDSGNFYLENPSPPSEDLRILLFKDKPPASSVMLIVNGRPWKIGEIRKTTDFMAEKAGDSSLSYKFSISLVTFKVKYFITNLENLSNNSIVCSIYAKNEGQNNSSVGGKFLFDTVYGEDAGKPVLYLSDREKIEYDRLFNTENLPQFVFSGAYNADLATFGNGIFIYPYLNWQKPEKLIIGNWKKLSDNELSYQIDPRSHFRYYIYSNPDAAVAAYFNNINIRPGEEVFFGTVLSVNKLSHVFISFDHNAASNNYSPALPEAPAVPGLQTGSKIPLTDERDILEKLSELVDRLTGTAPDSSIGKGIEKSAPESAFGDPFNFSNETFYTVYTNSYSTNMYPKEDVSRLEQQYNDKISKLKDYYNGLLNTNVPAPANKSASVARGSRDARSKKIGDVDNSISGIDKKISVIEELLELNLDFESMPPEKMNEIESKISNLEKKLD